MSDPDAASPFGVKTSMKEVFSRFKVAFDVLRNEQEQRELLERFVSDLERARHREAAARDYGAADLTKAQVKLVRQRLRKLATFFEEKRQQRENKAMKEAGDSVKKAVSEEIEDRYEDVLEDLYSKELAMYNLHERQVVQLEKEIAVEPPPKQRYTKRTIELRHAEKSLSQQQDFFNAARVRAKTKELELKEDAAAIDNHCTRMQRRREKLVLRHDGECKRIFEDVKKAKAVAKRNRDSNLKLVRNRIRYLEEGMQHGHVMHKHKVFGTTHNIELEPRKASKETRRGTTYKDLKIGKDYMAIPSLAATHVFDTVQKQIIEEARPRTASPIPNFRDPAWRMSARIDLAQPQSCALSPAPRASSSALP